jgi:hypothetical protein
LSACCFKPSIWFTAGAGSKCRKEDYPAYLSASFQLVDAIMTGTGPVLDFIATINSGNEGSSNTAEYGLYSQLNQQLYSLSCYQGGECIFTVRPDRGQSSVVDFQGTAGDGPQLEAQYGTFNYLSGQEIVLQDTRKLCADQTDVEYF